MNIFIKFFTFISLIAIIQQTHTSDEKDYIFAPIVRPDGNIWTQETWKNSKDTEYTRISSSISNATNFAIKRTYSAHKKDDDTIYTLTCCSNDHTAIQSTQTKNSETSDCSPTTIKNLLKETGIIIPSPETKPLQHTQPNSSSNQDVPGLNSNKKRSYQRIKYLRSVAKDEKSETFEDSRNNFRFTKVREDIQKIDDTIARIETYATESPNGKINDAILFINNQKILSVRIKNNDTLSSCEKTPPFVIAEQLKQYGIDITTKK